MSSNIYFRPAAEQPYYFSKVATWLVKIGKFKDYLTAYNALITLETHRPDLFKHYFDEYYRIHAFKVGYLVNTSDESKAFRSVKGAYGELPHMYYSRRLSD